MPDKDATTARRLAFVLLGGVFVVLLFVIAAAANTGSSPATPTTTVAALETTTTVQETTTTSPVAPETTTTQAPTTTTALVVETAEATTTTTTALVETTATTAAPATTTTAAAPATTTTTTAAVVETTTTTAAPATTTTTAPPATTTTTTAGVVETTTTTTVPIDQTVTVKVYGYDGSPLPGAAITVNDAPEPVGTTNDDGMIQFSVSPGDHTVKASIHGTSSSQAVSVGSEPTLVEFHTGAAWIRFSGTVTVNGSPVAGPTHLFAGTHTVALAGHDRAHPGVSTTINVEPKTKTKATGIYVLALDHSGAPLKDVAAELRAGGKKAVGITDTRGVTAALFDGHIDGRRSVKASVNGTTATVKQDLASNTIFDFATILATVEVLDAAGDPMVGIPVDQKAGPWVALGTTNEAGSVTFEAFAGTRRAYRIAAFGTTNKQAHKFTPKDAVLTFQAMKATVEVLDSTGTGMPGKTVDQRTKKWTTLGTTNEDGRVFFDTFPGSRITHRVSVNGTTASQRHTFTLAKPIQQFQTVAATVHVADSTGAPLPGVTVDQRTKKWATIGTTDAAGNVTFEAFSQKRKYRATVNGTTSAATHKFTTEKPTLKFQTSLATIVVRTKGGQPLESVSVEQKTSAWTPIGNTDASGTVQFEALASKRAYRATVFDLTKKKAAKFTAGSEPLELVFPNPPEDLDDEEIEE